MFFPTRYNFNLKQTRKKLTLLSGGFKQISTVSPVEVSFPAWNCKKVIKIKISKVSLSTIFWFF